MREYGPMKATEFTKKQINVVFGKAKAGELKVEKWFMNELYTLAEFYGYDDNRSVERSEVTVKGILEDVFAGNIENAQKRIDEAEDEWFKSYSAKNQSRCNRTIFVA